MNNFKLKQLFALGLLSLLTACASKNVLQTPTYNLEQQQYQINKIKHWSVKGRIAVTTPEEKFSSNYSWQHTPVQQELMLYGSLGITYAHLVQKEQLATLTLSDKDIFQSNDIGSLLENVFGYPLPINKMQYWFKGLPYPDNAKTNNISKLSYDELGFLKSISHEQWTISYKKYKSFKQFHQIKLPTKITITDGLTTIKLSNRGWQIGTDL